MSPSSPLSAALEGLLEELDRLMLVGHQGRSRRGAALLSVEALRYARIDVAKVLTHEAPAGSLRGLAEKLRAAGLGMDAPLSALANTLEETL